ncbi:MAG: hypothetical protein RBU45_13620 [Myxococcota bacterium]|jgi:hypothetical protein|nr:hypothetical protein [Myxococcota bacterium]
MRSQLTVVPFVLVVLLGGVAQARELPLGGFRAEAEVGPVRILQNDNAYGPDGTTFHADDVGQQDNLVFGRRLALELPLAARHGLVFVYAPLDVVTRATLGDAVQFNDTRFAAGTVVDSRYLFDGYRLSYLYAPLVREQLALQVGLSTQIRNAQVALTSVDGTQRAVESDIGLVGALKARLWWDPLAPGGPYLLLDADAFSTFGLVGDVTGAIYDLALSCGFPLAPGADLFVRGRLLGGGATVPDKDIDNWGNFASFTLGLRLGLESLLD